MDNDKLTLLIDIAVELHARETSNNCIHTHLLNYSWDDLCNRAIRILKDLKTTQKDPPDGRFYG